MNPATPNEQELHRLFAAKADETIIPEDHETLCVLLKDSAEVRQQWFAFQDAETALLAWSQRETSRREQELHISPPASDHEHQSNSLPYNVDEASADNSAEHNAAAKSRRGSQSRFFEAIAAAIILGTVIWTVWPKPKESPAPTAASLLSRDEATTTSVAVLSRGVNVEWDRTVAAPAVNAPLAPGLLRLQSGVVEIEFFQGARLCVEGPAEIRLVSAGEAFCSYGRFSAHVPPQARGFRIGTPKGDVVDLGTDFGLDLNAASPELHVFKGEVELHQPSMQVRKVTTGNAMDLGQPTQTLAANAAAFAFSHDLAERDSASRREAFARWQTASARWNDDTDLRLHLDFQDQETSHSLHNAALHGEEIAPGTIVGCNWTEGRWPGKNALQFRSVSDRVRLNIPGEYPQLTLTAWVQLHSLSARQSQSSLCMSQGIEAGGIHWQVLHDGSICLGIVASAHPKVTDDYISPVVFTPERFGQWTHLAAVLDSAAGEVRLYVNGQLLSRHALKRSTVPKPAIAELGNWIPSPDYHGSHPVRNFVGCMDDFTLSARAFTDAEVHQFAQ